MEADEDDDVGNFPMPPDFGPEVRSMLKVSGGADRPAVAYVTQRASQDGCKSIQELREWLARKQIQAGMSGFVKPVSRYEGANQTQIESLEQYLRYADKISTSIARNH